MTRRPPPDRRQVLRAGAGLLGLAALSGGVGGCTGDGRAGASDTAGPGTTDADEALLQSVRADQERVLAVSLAVLHRHPRLARTVRPLVARHRVHVHVLGGTAPTRRRQAPRSPAAALRLLVATEDTAAGARARDTVRAGSGDFARVLGALSAGQAQHVVILRAALAALASGGRA